MHIPLVQDYWIGTTYVHDPSPSQPPAVPAGIVLRVLEPKDILEIAASPDPDMSKRRAAVDAYCRRFGASKDGVWIGACTFSFGDKYDGYYRLKSREAELVDIFTTRQSRGMGIAALLIQYSTAHMHDLGFERLYAKIWHSNVASVRAFEKAGWRRQCFFVRVQPVGTSRSLQVRWPLLAR